VKTQEIWEIAGFWSQIEGIFISANDFFSIYYIVCSFPLEYMEETGSKNMGEY
jgi:hypothetical protein